MKIGFHRGAAYLLGGHDKEVYHNHDGKDDDDGLQKIKKSRNGALHKFHIFSVGDIIKVVNEGLGTRSSAG